MEINKGFKMTELGVLPEEWEVKKIGDVGVFSKGQGIRKDQSNSGDIPCIRYGELYTKHNNIIKEYYSKISLEVAAQARKLTNGSILFAGSGETKEEIGKCAAFIDDIIAYAGGDIVILEKHNQNPWFLGYLLNSPTIQKQKASRGQGDAVVHVSGNQLSSILIPLPTIAEQTAIATALSDMDALITHTDRLIQKKKAIKQGLMQELLLPKVGWEVRKLGEVVTFYKGKGLPKSQIKESGKFKCIHYGELFTKYTECIKTIISYTDENENCFYSISNDVLMPTSDVTPNGLATASCIKENGIILGGDILVIRAQPNIVDGVFFSYFVTENREKIMKLVSGSTVYHLYGSDMKDFILTFPPIEEQTRIAEILTDADTEIRALETKRTKLHAQKQGMMQVLLTGKIRLK